MDIEIFKMSGAGNLFTAIDNRKIGLDSEFWKNNAPRLCSDDFGFKSEGLIVMNGGSESLDFIADFLNPDGSSGMMCGNGGRCAVKLAYLLGMIKNQAKEVVFFMAGKEYKASFLEDSITLVLDAPNEYNPEITIPVLDQIFEATFVNVGTEHVCVDIDSVGKIYLPEFDLLKYGPAVRYHQLFAPRGTNFNIYKVTGKNSISMRTYERGVEAETGACGTGAISVAISAGRQWKVKLPVTITPSSGISIIVDINGTIENPEKVLLSGPAEIIGKKIVNLDILQNLTV